MFVGLGVAQALLGVSEGEDGAIGLAQLDQCPIVVVAVFPD